MERYGTHPFSVTNERSGPQTETGNKNAKSIVCIDLCSDASHGSRRIVSDVDQIRIGNEDLHIKANIEVG